MKPPVKKALPAQASPLHCAARRMKRSLKPGRAPSCWKKLVERRTSRATALHQFCAWAGEQARQRPRLMHQPLFGACLQELTGAGTRRVEGETGEATAPPAPLRWPWEAGAQPAVEGARPSATGKSGMPHGASAVPPGRPDPEAAQAMRVQAGKPHPLPTMAHRPLVQAELARLGRVRPQAYSGGVSHRKARPGGRRRQGAVAAMPRQAALQPWFEVQRARAIRRLQNPGSRSAAGASAQAAWSAESGQESGWQIELDGPTAPLELLARLAGVPVEDVLAIAPAARPGAPPRRPDGDGSAPTHPRTNREAAPGHEAGGSRLSGGRIIREAAQSRPQETLTGAQAPAPGVPLPAVTGSEFTPLAPPAATVSLPALSPPLKPYDPTLPVASATLQYGARRERVETAPEDLELLAARIKRILDEEARRHGIDV